MAKSSLDQPLLPGVQGLSFTQLFHILKAYAVFIAAVLAVTVLVTILLVSTLPKSYEATAALIIEFQSDDAARGDRLPSNLEKSYLLTQADVIRSQKVMLRVIEQMNLTEDPEVLEAYEDVPPESIDTAIARDMLEGLEVTVGEESRVINVTFTADDPQKAADVANAVASAYIDVTNELAQEPARALSESYQVQLNELRKQVEEAQARLTDEQQKAGVMELQEERFGRVDADQQRLNGLMAELVRAEGESTETAARADLIRQARKGGGSAVVQADILDARHIQDIKQKVLDLQTEFEEQSQVLGPNHPRYKGLQKAIADAEKRLKAEVKEYGDTLINEAKVAARREAKLRDEVDEQRQLVLNIKRSRDEVSLYLREFESAKRIYEQTLDKFDDIMLDTQIDRSSAAVVSRAVPPDEHVAPKKKPAILIAIVLGLIVGAGLALLIELTNRKIRSKEDLATELDAPVLAEF